LAGEILIARRASPQGPQKRGEREEEEEEEREEKKKREEKETREEEEILHYVSCMQHFATEVSELKLSSMLICADTSYVQARICTSSLCLLCYYLFLKAYL
jgi:hypothetical protein